MSIEFVFWVPLVVGLLGLSADATMLFFGQQLMYDATRDASRQVALGSKTAAEAKADLETRLEYEGINAEVTINGEYVSAFISAPFDSVMIFSGNFTGDARLSATVTMWIEDNA